MSFASVRYVTDPSNPLPGATRATTGTSIMVTAMADETLSTLLADTPTLSAFNGADTLVFSTANNDERGAVFRTDPGDCNDAVDPPLCSDGTYVPTLVWTDLVGNQNTAATFATPMIEVKTSTPTLTVDQAEVTYWRSPWGNAASETVGAFVIPAGPYFALAPKEPLSGADTLPAPTFSLGAEQPTNERIWADASMGSLMGTVTPNLNGAWPRQQLANLDTPAIYATGLDAAGNESLPMRIESTEGVATPNPPGFGQSPHQLDSTSYVESRLIQNPLASSEAGGGAEGSDTLAVLARADGLWREQDQSSRAPSARRDHAMAYDSARGVVVLFGCSGATGPQQDTWEWDGATWAQVSSTGPPSRYSHAMAYDSQEGVVVLFGGSGAALRQDTWEWDAKVSRKPALLFGASMSAAGIAAGAITSLRVRAHCGGEYSPFTATDAGATLLGWSTGLAAAHPASGCPWPPTASPSTPPSPIFQPPTQPSSTGKPPMQPKSADISSMAAELTSSVAPRARQDRASRRLPWPWTISRCE